MKVAVFGPRDHKGSRYKNYNHVAGILESFDGISLLLSGGGEGVEQLALRFAAENKIPERVIPPKIKVYGAPTAFLKRNEELIRESDFVIVLWDGKTTHYVELMSSVILAGKPLSVFNVE